MEEPTLWNLEIKSDNSNLSISGTLEVLRNMIAMFIQGCADDSKSIEIYLKRK